MFHRRQFLAVAAVALATSSLAARAEVGTPFTAAAFAAATAAGKPVLVDIAADWCPVCKAQHPVVQGLKAKPDFADLVVLTVDFDTQKDVVRSFGAQHQSTLIVFRGTKETGRSVGDTDPASIEALLRSAI